MADSATYETIGEGLSEHYARDAVAEDNWFLELAFPVDGVEFAPVQVHGSVLHVVTMADDDRRDRLFDLVEREGLDLLDRGENFVTVAVDGTDPASMERVLDALVTDVYDRTPADVTAVRERTR